MQIISLINFKVNSNVTNYFQTHTYTTTKCRELLPLQINTMVGDEEAMEDSINKSGRDLEIIY